MRSPFCLKLFAFLAFSVTLATSSQKGSAEVFGPDVFNDMRFAYTEMNTLVGPRWRPSVVAHQAFDGPVACIKLSYQLAVPERSDELMMFVAEMLGDLQAHTRALAGPENTPEYADAMQSLQFLDIFFSFFPDQSLPNIVEPGSPEWSDLSADWNSGCIDRALGYSDVVLPLSARIGAEDLRERISFSGDRITIEGQIEAGFSDRLKEVIQLHPEARVVAVSSNGGSVIEAMRAGRLIRTAGLSTTLVNSCDSSCVLVFLGGVSRQIWQPAPQIRMHQLGVRSSNGEMTYIDVSDELYGVIGDYVTEMGANAEMYIGMMGRSTELEQVYWADLCDARIATWVQRYCSR